MKQKRTYWIEFFEFACVLCGDYEVWRERVYDRPKPAEWNERHHVEEHACMEHFL